MRREEFDFSHRILYLEDLIIQYLRCHLITLFILHTGTLSSREVWGFDQSRLAQIQIPGRLQDMDVLVMRMVVATGLQKFISSC